jgi:hypothetical protein
LDAATVGILGAVATVAAVVISHWLNQRSGEQRANHVREEVLSRIASVETRIAEVKSDFASRLTELRSDDAAHAAQLRSEMNNTVLRVESRVDALKEVFSLELKALKAEILAALPARVRRVGETSPPHGND